MQLRPARRLLIFASAVTLALNVADPLVAGQYGKAAFDAVGPLLLIGWAEVGPDLLRELVAASRLAEATLEHGRPVQGPSIDEPTRIGLTALALSTEDLSPDGTSGDKEGPQRASRMIDDDLLESAREADASHWDAYRRPISADTLRRKLRIGAERSRLLVKIIRDEAQGRSSQDEVTAHAGV